jgi:hypothetical protein
MIDIFYLHAGFDPIVIPAKAGYKAMVSALSG